MLSDAVAGLFTKLGPAVLITHSASGLPGWLTQTKSDDVKAVVSYEPVGRVLAEGEVPAPITTEGGPITGTPISPPISRS